MAIGVGILGSGYMGRTYAFGLKEINHDARLVAVAGGTRAQQLAADYGADAVPTPEALIARPDVDAVVIATPHSTHLPLTLAADGGRQARLPREADGPDRGRVRRDDRRGRPAPESCSPSTRSRDTAAPARRRAD